jgi:Amt family ammonium transporter
MTVLPRLRLTPTWGLLSLLTACLLCLAAPSFGEDAKPDAAPAPAAATEDPHTKEDPAGATIGSDFGLEFSGAVKKGEPTQAELTAQVTRLRGGLNMLWTCLAGFLVFFMQAGFALVETGFTRAKNAAHTMGMNMMVFCIGFIGYYVSGFAFMFGGVGALPTLGGSNILNSYLINIGDWHILGGKGFCWAGLFDSQVMAFFMFQMVFMDTAATIPTGSMAERIKWGAFVWMSFFMTMFMYPLIGCWVWGGGWLTQFGAKWAGETQAWGNSAVDFSGSGVIHMVGGWTALAGAIVLGPRLGKYDKNGNARPIPGHDIPMAVLGTIILFFGWFGFNPGSTLAATDGILPVAAVNTMIAGAFGGFSSMLYMMFVHPARKPDPGMCCNGVLAGLVAITAPCAFVSPTASVIIGVIAGVLVILAVGFVENTLKVDDPVGAFAVHGCNGLFGILCVGLFACGTYGAGLNNVTVHVDGKDWGVLGMFPIGGPAGTPWMYMGQMKAQIFFAFVDIVTVFGIQYAFFKVYHAVFGLRVKPEDEIAGLDIPEVGCPAYPNWPIHDAPGLAVEGTPQGQRDAAPATAAATVRAEPA